MGVWIETLPDEDYTDAMAVTPYVGVWIETEWVYVSSLTRTSLLMWECGLKPCVKGKGSVAGGVTPYVGVWIETITDNNQEIKANVTPYVGVWIETRRVRADR